MNKYLSELFADWKKGLDDQIDKFQSVADDIRTNEENIITNHQIVRPTP